MIHNNSLVPGKRGCVELGEVVGHLPFFALRVLSELARHEIVSVVKPRGAWIQEVSGVP